ncbi:OmpA family protein [Nannocystis exedens]|uniref:OmpA family protein n=1 Tax=Nannocystis exedens TaxID=54 RepID=A0A1I2EBR4_9BACT|nr:OmpA family protein [Nannocystis exedens]PCC74836.1 OmpA family protein [Nannocystis exedens]SFE90036.1 OmpA family protein [Nannocystis exedens]
MRRTSATASLAAFLACSGPQVPERPQPPPVSECAAILATIPYAATAIPLQLDPDGLAELDEWIARLRADPRLRVELGVHMAAAARAGADPAQVHARMRRLGVDLLARVRAEVRPAARVALVVHGVPGGPADDLWAGSWVQLRRVCPPFAPDLDADGVADALDRCRDDPEDHDRFADDDGCPDRDNDGDGLLDAARWTGSEWINCDGKLERGIHRRDCRDEPETVNGEQDDDGCPEALVADCGRFVVRIGYDPVTRELDPDGFLELDARRKQLGQRLSTRGVFVLEGHTAAGMPPAEARQLGLDMADKARAVLIDRGFVHHALEVRSRGADQPIADNDSDEGRRANHRVEIVAGLACLEPSSPLCP